MKKFIDFDRKHGVIFDNLYLDDQKIVVKIPMTNKGEINKTIKKDLKIDKFDICKYTFLANY